MKGTETHNHVIMNAHVKTGQHWILFVIANYQRLVNNKKPIIWSEVMRFSKFKPTSLLVHPPDVIYNSENVNFCRIEYPYNHYPKVGTFVQSFDKCIYLYRNPYDVMISMFYYFHTEQEEITEINSKKDFKGWEKFENYVRDNIDHYIQHIREGIDHFDMVLYYDDLKKDPSPFREVLKFFYNKIDEALFQKTLEISSFDYVHQMEKNLPAHRNQKRVDMRLHARDGRVGQYKILMSKEIINLITEKWNKLKTEIKYPIK